MMINGVSYNELGQIFEAVFNIKPAFSIPAPPSVRAVEQFLGKGGYPDVRTRQGHASTETGTSWMETPILFPFRIGGEKLKTFDVEGNLVEKEYAQFEMPAATLVDFSREKEIVRTKTASGYGTVKELFSVGDWQISIRGLCLNEGPDRDGVIKRAAIDIKNTLLLFEQVVGSIKVEGWLFKDMRIDRIVINNMTFRQVEGKPWVIPFEMTCEADIDPVLSLKTGNELRRVM